MIKAIIFGVLLYFAYKLFIDPILIAGKKEADQIKYQDKKPKKDFFKESKKKLAKVFQLSK